MDIRKLCVRETGCGTICGLDLNFCEAYLGIRYATAERWERAVQLDLWENEYDATEFGDRACQFRGFYGVEDSAINQFYYEEALVQLPARYSEDCLNLNIWTPKDAAGLPVLVYIHGGAFLTGGNSEPFIDGAAYTQKGVILVSINYRLGPFATAYGEGYTGNCALTDQITALTWIRSHISDFGGNPLQVTIMGESAGAVSVQDLIASPLARGLFCGAVMMSGGGDLSSLGNPTYPGRVEPIWARLKGNLMTDSITQMKDFSPASIYAGWQKALRELPQYASGAVKPVVDGAVLPFQVTEAQTRGELADIPCIIGILSEDSWPYTLYTAAINYAAAQNRMGGKPVYTYFFDRKPPGENQFGAYHAADLWYVFGTLDRSWRPFEEADTQISKNMINYICNFARTGDPNGVGLTTWEPVFDKRRHSLRFGENSVEMCLPDLDQLWQTQKICPAFPYK